jgi:hypothetical protein
MSHTQVQGLPQTDWDASYSVQQLLANWDGGNSVWQLLANLKCSHLELAKFGLSTSKWLFLFISLLPGGIHTHWIIV